MEKGFIWSCGMLVVLVVFEGTVVNGKSNMLFVFGDSLLDCGTNNYLGRSMKHRANYYPYGMSFSGGNATGRYSDGMVTPDYIAQLADIPHLIPPYLDPTADFSFGANFASGGAGALKETNAGEVVWFSTQIEQFKTLQEKFRRELGDMVNHRIFPEAVYQFSIGMNDYKMYVQDPQLQDKYELLTYVEMVLEHTFEEIDKLYELGARKFLAPLLKDLGCSPGMRALNDGECHELATLLCESHNLLLEYGLFIRTLRHADFQYIVFDQIPFMKERIEAPHEYGFLEGREACCGSGLLRGENTCGGKNDTPYELCGDPSKHVYFDAFHCTSGINRQASFTMWHGNDPTVRPIALKKFFNSNIPIINIGHKGKPDIPSVVEASSPQNGRCDAA
ncbi:hypothetical protein AMTR_s00016p00247790 [Amborella trichopoda]|uniref:Uncharacterized protein n=1 Tax=Amborella trichopoda TaxID=13333 RepID=W1PFF0_AMBTC|nr:hypothetical protein AMTR_s00016p00247790 [Amborella trichopoda]